MFQTNGAREFPLRRRVMEKDDARVTMKGRHPMLNVKTNIAKAGYFKQLEVSAEGQLVADWADFLEREVEALGKKSLPIVVDVTCIDELDENGIESLTRLVERGVHVVGLPSLLTSYVVETALAC